MSGQILHFAPTASPRLLRFRIGLGAVFSIFWGTFSKVIRSEGASGDAMIGNIAGSVTNIMRFSPSY